MMENHFVTEPALIGDVFATGILPVEHLEGGCLRITYYVTKSERLGENLLTDNIVVARMIIPEECLLRMAQTVRNGVPALKETALLNG